MMTAPTEEPLGTVGGQRDHTAFGLALRVDPRISISGLGWNPDSMVAQPPTRIRLDEDELDQRWKALSTPPVRMREVRFGETLIRSVDFGEPAGYLLWARDHGRVLISSDGTDLLCEPDPANEDWAIIISAQALPLAATIRGFEVLHASGVVLGDRAVLLTGPSGAGKSSLVAELVRGGGQLLSDDAVALQLHDDGALVAHAGSVALQLRVAEDERLSANDRAALGRPAGSVEGKRRYLRAETPEAATLGCVFLLEHSERKPAVERLPAVDPFELIASTFNLSVRTPARLRRQLDVVSAIASGGLAYRLRRQPGVDAGQLAAIIQEHSPWMDAQGEGAPSDAQSSRTRSLDR